MTGNRYLSSVLSLGVLLTGAAALMACPASLDDRCADGACVDGGNPGVGPTVDGGDGGIPVDPCFANPTAPECASEELAFFVSASSGHDDAAGTKAAPLQTITAALGKITDTKRRLYVCPGTYAEDVVLTGDHSNVSIYGGLDCTFAATTAAKPQVGKSTMALRASNAAGISVSSLTFAAAAASNKGESSIAALFVNGSGSFANVDFTAGAGEDGQTAAAAPYSYPDSLTTLKGIDGTQSTPGVGVAFACPGGMTTNGGSGGASGVAGTDGSPGATKNGGTIAACSDTTPAGGGTGGAGNAGNDGASATLVGTLAADGWTPSGGARGGTGTPGQGGGGGSAVGGTGNTGGGGGAGGCGGNGGPPGSGGGASIGFACYFCSVAFSSSSFTTGRAGAGGAGAAGQHGQQTFGAGGRGYNLGCNGGPGGKGGNGGSGGAGAGGVSVGVLFKGVGEPPALDDASKSQIRTGTAGAAGTAPQGMGVAGSSEPVLSLP